MHCNSNSNWTICESNIGYIYLFINQLLRYYCIQYFSVQYEVIKKLEEKPHHKI